MSHTPRGPDAHAPEFLANRGSRTGRDRQNSPGSSDSESGDISLEDDLGLNSVRGLARRASAAIEDAASTDGALWGAMADNVTGQLAALYREREPLQTALDARRAESSRFEQGRGRRAEKELEERIKAHEAKELAELADVDAIPRIGFIDAPVGLGQGHRRQPYQG